MYADNVVTRIEDSCLILTVDLNVGKERRELERRGCIASVIDSIEVAGELLDLDFFVYVPTPNAERHARAVWRGREQECPSSNCTSQLVENVLTVYVNTRATQKSTIVYTNQEVPGGARFQIRLTRPQKPN